jgi:hypothetical protein
MAFALALGLALQSCSTAAAQNNRISLELRDAELQSALTMLFKNSGKSFVIEGGAQGLVNVSLNDVSWDQALRAVLDSLGLTATIDQANNVYHIYPASTAPPSPPRPPEVENPPTPPPTAEKPTSEGATNLGIIPVRHASVMDMAFWFGGTAAYSSVSGGGGMTRYGIGGYGGGYGGYGGGYGGYGGGYGGYGGIGGYGRSGYGGIGGYGTSGYGGIGGYGTSGYGGVGGYGRSGYGGVGGYGRSGYGGIGGYGRSGYGGIGGYSGLGGYGGIRY